MIVILGQGVGRERLGADRGARDKGVGSQEPFLRRGKSSGRQDPVWSKAPSLQNKYWFSIRLPVWHTCPGYSLGDLPVLATEH